MEFVLNDVTTHIENSLFCRFKEFDEDYRYFDQFLLFIHSIYKSYYLRKMHNLESYHVYEYDARAY